MPKTIKNAVETEFRGKDRMTRSLGVMSRGMQRLNRMTGRAKRGLIAAGKAVAFLGRAMLTGLKVGIGAAIGGIGALTAVVWKLSSSFSMIEDAQAGFTPLMGSVEGATKLVDELNKTAATTPFQFETLSDTAKQLLPSMNGNIERTIQLTRMLGDTAGGNAQKLESITRGYNKALIKGKVDLEALNMIAEAGVPIFQELGKTTGVSGKRLFKNISNGKVSVEQLTKTFTNMTSEGGIFFRGMEIASETLSGKISTLKDNANLAMAEFGRAMAPTLKEAADEATRLAQKISAWAKENQDLIRTKFKEYFDKFVKALKDGYKWVVDNKDEIKKFGTDLVKFGKTLFEIGKTIWKYKDAIIALVVAYKTLRTSLSLMDFAGFIGNAGKAGAAVDGVSGKVKGLAGIVGKGGLLVTAFAAGWAVGSVIFDKWNDAASNLALNAENMAARVSMSFRKMSDDQLKNTDRTLAAQEQKLTSTFESVKAFVTGNYQEHQAAIKAVKDARIKGLTEQFGRLSRGNELVKERERLGFMAGRQSGGVGDQPALNPVDMPQAQVSRSETVTREVTEVVIRDETGRAEVTKGKSTAGLTLAHTGGM